MEIENTETVETTEGTTAPDAAPEVQEAESIEAPEAEQDDELAKLLKEATGESEETDDGPVDVEYDGKSYKLPRELKDALLRQADYTRKTMDVAEQRKAIEAERQQLEAFQGLATEEMDLAVRYQMTQTQMQQLLDTNLDDLTQEEINSLRLNFNDLERQANQTALALQQAVGKRQQLHSQQFTQAREAAFAEASKRIPNFNERRETLENLARSMGANDEVVASLADPMVYEVLHYADIGKKFVESQRKAKRVTDAQAAQPASEVAGKATKGKSPESMSPEEYHAYRLKRRTGG